MRHDGGHPRQRFSSRSSPAVPHRQRHGLRPEHQPPNTSTSTAARFTASSPGPGARVSTFVVRLPLRPAADASGIDDRRPAGDASGSPAARQPSSGQWLVASDRRGKQNTEECREAELSGSPRRGRRPQPRFYSSGTGKRILYSVLLSTDLVPPRPPAPHSRLRVLFVDDERSLQEFMRTELPRLGHDVTVCPNGDHRAASPRGAERSTSAILDIRMPGISGIDVFQRSSSRCQPGHRSRDDDRLRVSEDSMVQAMRLGRVRLPAEAVQVVGNRGRAAADAADKKKLKNEGRGAREPACRRPRGRPGLIGTSPAMRQVQHLIDQQFGRDGRAGADYRRNRDRQGGRRPRFVHLNSRNGHDMPFVPVNCGAVVVRTWPRASCSGTKKGSFTGADRDRKGMFEVANGGHAVPRRTRRTRPEPLQVKLLRFLESGEKSGRSGRQRSRSSPTCGSICATNREPAADDQ